MSEITNERESVHTLRSFNGQTLKHKATKIKKPKLTHTQTHTLLASHFKWESVIRIRSVEQA